MEEPLYKTHNTKRLLLRIINIGGKADSDVDAGENPSYRLKTNERGREGECTILF